MRLRRDFSPMTYQDLHRHFESELPAADFSQVAFVDFLTQARIATSTEELALSPRQIGVLRALYNQFWQANFLRAGQGNPALLTEPEAED
jgi:hypothetical protein